LPFVRRPWPSNNSISSFVQSPLNNKGGFVFCAGGNPCKKKKMSLHSYFFYL
jgi:hypothetical protein